VGSVSWQHLVSTYALLGVPTLSALGTAAVTQALGMTS